jgi:hypothetical protein
VGVDLYPECARECGVDGVDLALPLAARWLSLALDLQLDRPHCHQHVALPIFGVVIIPHRADPDFFDETISKMPPYYYRLKQISTRWSAILNSLIHF